MLLRCAPSFSLLSDDKECCFHAPLLSLVSANKECFSDAPLLSLASADKECFSDAPLLSLVSADKECCSDAPLLSLVLTCDVLIAKMAALCTSGSMEEFWPIRSLHSQSRDLSGFETIGFPWSLLVSLPSHHFRYSFIHPHGCSPNTGGHPYIHIYVIGAKRKFCSDHVKLLIISTMYIWLFKIVSPSQSQSSSGPFP